MLLNKGEVLTIKKAQVTVIGLAIHGRGSTHTIDGPGSLAMPTHQVTGIYAGFATHGLSGNCLSKPIPVLIICDNDNATINIRVNGITGAWLCSDCSPEKR